jgi:DNA-binding NarL/FixJ family response regulator
MTFWDYEVEKQRMVAQTQRAAQAVVIADRSAHVRETLRRVLAQSGCDYSVQEAANFRDALRSVRSGARLVLLDVELAMNQPAARLRRIVNGIPGLRVIVLLNEDLPEYRRAIADRWGYRCVAKEHAESELPETLKRCAMARRTLRA